MQSTSRLYETSIDERTKMLDPRKEITLFEISIIREVLLEISGIRPSISR